MLGTASDRLRYLSPSIQSLMRSLASAYPEFPFLAGCLDSLAEGKPFAESFATAVQQSGLGESLCAVLLPLAGELGSSDLDSQLAALAYAQSRLQEISEGEQEYCRSHTKLYRSLGLMGGIAIAILFY